MSHTPSIRSRRTRLSRSQSLSFLNNTKMESQTQASSFKRKLQNYCCQTKCCHLDGEDLPKIINISWKRVLTPILFVGTLLTVGVLLYIYLRPTQDTVCFTRVGCFSITGPWASRPSLFNLYPHSPFYINTTFIVTSSDDPDGIYGVVSMPALAHFGVVNEHNIPWNTSSTIVFLVHGFTDTSQTWMRGLKDAFLDQGDDTVVVMVDWEQGASGFARYPQVVANTRVVAREMVLFIKYIQRRYGHPSAPKKIHLVGHSLGSQISSYVGKEFANTSYPIYQITALDPAYPLFEGYPKEIRLHRTDAIHVVVIHSNIGSWGLGMKDPVGSVDIYLNDGRDQRGCFKMGGFKNPDGTDVTEMTDLRSDNNSLPKIVGALDGVNDKLSCSHRRAHFWLQVTLRSLVGTLYERSSHKPIETHAVAYPILWENGSDILSLTRSRSINYSFCKENNEGGHGCWKLEKSDSEAFFRLPELSNNSVYFIPTADEPPFCVRFALLEIETCPEPSGILRIFQRERTNVDRLPHNVSLSFSQVIFDDEVPIYHGSRQKSKPKVTAWVEFPCKQLQQPGRSNEDGNSISLNVQLMVALDDDSKRSDKNATKVQAPDGPSFCANKMELVYFNETSGTKQRLPWIQNNNGNSTMTFLRSGQCVNLQFGA